MNSPLLMDTNVFLRFLTNDVPEQAEAVERLLADAATGRRTLITNAMVVAELVWVLESYYKLPRTQIHESAMAVLTMDGLTVPDSDVMAEALTTYLDMGVDFIDAYNAAWMRGRGLETVVSFDRRHMSRIEGISVVVPERPHSS